MSFLNANDWLSYLCTIDHKSAVAKGRPHNGNIFWFFYGVKEDLEMLLDT